jgi:glutamyl-tRNA(Gln) amidotransferase subunit E
VVACLTRLPNILTSENPEETIGSYTWKKIYSAVSAESKDSQILVWGDEQDVTTGVQEIIIRAREALIGIPSETRQALADGTNGFERILPGPNRMYPDTDLPPLEITSGRIQGLSKNLPKPLWEREKQYRQVLLPEHQIRQIVKSDQAKLFDALLEKYKIKPVKIAGLIFEKARRWKRQNLPVEKIKAEDWYLFFNYTVKQLEILESSDKIFSEYLVNPDSKLSEILDKFVPPAVQDKDLNQLIEKAMDEEVNKIGDDNKKHRFIMGKVMEQCRGHIAGQKVSIMVWRCLRERGKK